MSKTNDGKIFEARYGDGETMWIRHGDDGFLIEMNAYDQRFPLRRAQAVKMAKAILAVVKKR